MLETTTTTPKDPIMKKSSTSRRDFLKNSAVASAVPVASFTVPYFAWTEKAYPNFAKNDRIAVGVIGCGAMGKGDAGRAKFHGADIVAVCDVDSTHTDIANKKVADGKADKYSDYRKLLERDDIGVVIVATPDHWHTRPLIDAIKAGKDVYCEKPLTLTVGEGELVQKVLADHPDRIVQVGTQQRSDVVFFLKALALVQEGRLGKIKRVQCAVGATPATMDYEKTQPPPHLNWDNWLGQTPKVDYIPERCHNNFRWWYEYSGGKMTDWGAHHVDIARWVIGDEAGDGPVRITGTATHSVPFKDGYPTIDNQYNTAQEFNITCKFSSGVELVMRHDTDNGILIEGTKGRIFVNRGKLTGKPVEEMENNPLPADALKKVYKGVEPYTDNKWGWSNHWHQYLDCVRERREPISDVASHLQAIDLCHMANLCIRLGEPIRADDPTIVKGRPLTWDPAKRLFVADEQACSFLKRKQRAGYEILG